MLFRPLVAAVLAVPLLAMVAQAAPLFRDIPADSWARRPAEVLAERRVMPGRTPIDFAGEAVLTRYELAHILSVLDTVDGSPSSFIVLKDMEPGHFATLDVQRVLDYRLMVTRRPGQFQGNGSVTRQDVVVAMNTLLQKVGIEAPSRKAIPILFTDVRPGTPLYQALDQVVNRYGLIELPPNTAFRPGTPVTRYQVLDILARAMPYLNPQINAALKEPVASPSPAESAGVSPGASPGAGVVGPTSGPLHSRVLGRLELVPYYDETLPTDAGLTAANEPKEISGGGGVLGGGGLGGEWWSDRFGVTGSAAGYYLPLSVPIGGKTYTPNMLDAFVTGAGYYVVASSTSFQLALGADALFRSTYNLSSDLVNSTYQTADKTYLGLGPALALGLRLAPAFDVVTILQTYPLLMESYVLPAGNKSLFRLGGDLTLRGEYALSPSAFVGGQAHTFLGAGGGGTQVLVGLGLDAGAKF